MRISFSRICYFCWLLTPWQTYSSCTSLIVSVEEGSLFPEKMNTSLARFNTWSLLALFVTCILKILSNRTKRIRSNTAADALLARKWFGHDPSASHHYGSSLKYKVVRKINTSWLWMSMYWELWTRLAIRFGTVLACDCLDHRVLGIFVVRAGCTTRKIFKSRLLSSRNRHVPMIFKKRAWALFLSGLVVLGYGTQVEL